MLDQGKIEKLALALGSIESNNPDLPASKFDREDPHRSCLLQARCRTHAPPSSFARRHLFAGSGVTEAGCTTVISSRLKRSGMF
jgi:hypothetical protein